MKSATMRPRSIEALADGLDVFTWSCKQPSSLAVAVSWVALEAFFWDQLERRHLHRARLLLCGRVVDIPTFILGRWVFGR